MNLAPDLDLVNDIKKILSHHFNMKDLDKVDLILDMKIICTSNSICLSQSHFTQMIINKFRYFDYSFVSTPYDSSGHLLKNIKKSVNQKNYIQIINSLMYLSN